jgi:hypothetical protein
MRLLLELIVGVALLALAWQKSFKEWASDIPGLGPHLTQPAQSPQRKDATTPAPATSAAPTAFTGHIYYTDESGKRYWLDASGRRHYAP